MCGITGYIKNNNNYNKEVLSKMMDRIKHRGPDGYGKYEDNYISLGHVRLSIIDLTNGNQPMFNEDNNIITIFNGEIYNYVELKSELIKKKHIFLI